jgi:hypothetical protein
MLKVVHIKDLNKFPFVDRFHVKVIDLENKSNNFVLSTIKNIDIATGLAKDIKNKGDLGKSEKVIVTRETIIQMY